MLARDPSNITLLDILNSIEKGKALFQTSFNILAQGKRPDNAQKSISKLFGEVEAQMKTSLAQKTINDILLEMNN